MARSNRSEKARKGEATDLLPEQRRPFELEVRIDDTPVHRCPSGVTRSLRYLLSGGHIPGRLSITSALHGEGVTAISRTLAALIANDWQARTCWVDLNWWKHGTPNNESTLFEATIAD